MPPRKRSLGIRTAAKKAVGKRAAVDMTTAQVNQLTKSVSDAISASLIPLPVKVHIHRDPKCRSKKHDKGCRGPEVRCQPFRLPNGDRRYACAHIKL